MQPDTNPPQTPSTQPPTPPTGPTPPAPMQPQTSPPHQPTPSAPAPPESPQQPQPKKSGNSVLKGFLSFAGFVVSVVILATLINLFIFQSYYVDGTSMTPTLQPNERLIINKLPKTWASVTHSHFTPKRGEIVVFNSELISPENGQREQLIKRVIGLPGERVVVKDNKVTIYNKEHPNGFNPDESLHLSLAPTDGDVDIVVPKDEIFVCGDNRAAGGSYDSRSEMGPIPTDKLVGELVMRLVPLNKAKMF